MSTAIVRHDQTVNTLDDVQRVAKLLAASNYFDAKGNGETAIAQVATKVLAGREMGYGPFASVNGIHIIQGRPSVSANLMAAAVKASGRYDYRVRQMTAEVCEIEFFERVDGKRESLGVSSFTAADAKAAQTQNMSKFARNMLFARAMSNGVKWFTPDVFNGSTVYTPEELGAEVDADGEYIDVAPTAVRKEAPQPTTTESPVGAATVTGLPNGSTNGHGGQRYVESSIGLVPAAAMQRHNESVAADCPSDDGWGNWTTADDNAAAYQWAKDSGKFGHDKHLSAAWTLHLRTWRGKNAADALNAWREYVNTHEDAKPASVPAMADVAEMVPA